MAAAASSTMTAPNTMILDSRLLSTFLSPE